MRIGVMIGSEASLDDVIGFARKAETSGIDSVWMANFLGFDAISTLALVGRETKRIALGTAVTPTYPRHPTAIAQQALTTAAASGNRFTLGVGLSHQMVIESLLGMSYAKPARHMREYLSVLMPLARRETVTFSGEQYRVAGVALDVPGAEPMPVVVAALGPMMLKLAGELADGTSTWMVGPKTMAGHIIPNLKEGAAAAGRSDPRVVAGFPMMLTTKPDVARQKIAERLKIYGGLPSYRAMLDLEGVTGPADIALVGTEVDLRREIIRLKEIGVTDFHGAIMDVEEGAYARTLEFLGSISG